MERRCAVFGEKGSVNKRRITNVKLEAYFSSKVAGGIMFKCLKIFYFRNLVYYRKVSEDIVEAALY